jgi:hypothetical protein
MRPPQRYVSSHQQVQHRIPHQQQQFMQQYHMLGGMPHTVVMQPVGYPPLEEDSPAPQMDGLQGWNPHTGNPAVVHGAVPYHLPPQMAYEPAFMYHHHGLQPPPVQYGYATVQAGLRYHVAPQQVQWHSAQAQQVQAQPVSQPGKEVQLGPLNPDYAAYAFQDPFDSNGGGIVYEAPPSAKGSETTGLSAKYAMFAFKKPSEEEGTTYEAPSRA